MRYKIIGWMVSAFFVGIAGGLMGHINGYIEPTKLLLLDQHLVCSWF